MLRNSLNHCKGIPNLKSPNMERRVWFFRQAGASVCLWENWGSWERCLLSPTSPPEQGKPWLWWRSRQGQRWEWEKALALSHLQRLSVKQPLEVINSPHVK